MLNEMEIKKYCEMYGLNYKYFYDTAIITGVDMWKLTEVTVKTGNIILVEHENKAGNRTKKMQFHSQRIAYDIEWIFENIIIPHQSYNRVYQKAFTVKKLLALA